MEPPVSTVRETVIEVARRHQVRGKAGQRSVLVGLIGRGIGSSRTPRMHEREGDRLGIPCTYALIDLDQHADFGDALGDVLALTQEIGFAGVNVTHPYKQSIMACLTDLAPDARAIGAVNTVVFHGSSRVGHNTDSWGFKESFRLGLAGSPLSSVLQLGAGGGGAAVAHALLELGVERLEIADPDRARAQGLAESLSRRFGKQVVAVEDPEAALPAAAGVVNTTPIGMDKYPGVPFNPAGLTARQWVADIIYFPVETALLTYARALGCRTLGGSGMAVFQAVKAFELFTGVVPSSTAMTGHFEAAA